jgi:hypothetical protein
MFLSFFTRQVSILRDGFRDGFNCLNPSREVSEIFKKWKI